jgi:hypothetical protein
VKRRENKNPYSVHHGLGDKTPAKFVSKRMLNTTNMSLRDLSPGKYCYTEPAKDDESFVDFSSPNPIKPLKQFDQS